MRRRKKIAKKEKSKLILVCILILSFLACKNDKPKIIHKSIIKKKRNIIVHKKKLTKKDNLTKTIKKKFVYDITEIKRDPFLPFIELKQEKYLKALLPKNVIVTPLNEYSIDQYKLVAVMTDKKPPLAMVETVDEKGFIFSIGDYIGSEFYKVIDITLDYVLLRKKYMTFDKKIKYEEKYLKFNTSGE